VLIQKGLLLSLAGKNPEKYRFYWLIKLNYFNLVQTYREGSSFNDIAGGKYLQKANNGNCLPGAENVIN
jgi:hypothetical protein